MQTRFSLMEICLETQIQFVNLLVEYLRLSLTALVCVGVFLWVFFFFGGVFPHPPKKGGGRASILYFTLSEANRTIFL